MANTVTNALQMTILSTEDGTNNVLVNRSATPSLDENVADYVAYGKGAIAVTALPFPEGITNITKLYIRNLSAAGSLLINATPQGGVAANLALLGPGDVFCYFQDATGAPAVSGISQGYSAVSVSASVANLLYEYFMGA